MTKLPVLPAKGFIELDGERLEYRLVGRPPVKAPTLILLHEGLGCVGLWGDFPEKLAAATKMSVFAYSRAGYGASSPVSLPRPLTYMHQEAQKTLPKVLKAIGFRRGILVGHSDGASIAVIYAGSVQDHRIRGLALIAPHFFTEDVGLAEIAKAKKAYRSGDLKKKLARWHKHVNVAFKGWNNAWLNPEFRQWNIVGFLEYIRTPMLILQGTDDQYGTSRQITVARDKCHYPVDVVMLDGVKHAPHRDAPDLTVRSIAEFAKRLLGTYEPAA
jgi:pimeloyl-ACP methyl ester carboxylesterase